MQQSRLFGSGAFRRLWFSQVASSIGDWIGIIAITAIANRVAGKGSGSAATALVLAVRLVPGFFFSPIAGVLLDRWNRKTVMVVCDFGRAAVLCSLPFVNGLWSLIVASFLLELLTLLWSPAKDATVPNLVPTNFLPQANSLSLAAAYGTIPFASSLFALLASVPAWIGNTSTLSVLHLDNESLALYVDALTYMISAATIATLAIPRTKHVAQRQPERSRTAEGLREAREGLSFIKHNTRVRAVIVGLAAALVGGGMMVPLGSNFATVVLGAGSSGYGLLLTGMGIGVAIGVIGLTVFQKKIKAPQERIFVVATLGTGISLLVAASMNGLGAAVITVGLLGLFAGSAYVTGFSSVQINTSDELRGRVMSALYTVTRVCIVSGLALASLLPSVFNHASEYLVGRSMNILGMEIALSGVRITLWLGGAVIVVASILATHELRRSGPSNEQMLSNES